MKKHKKYKHKEYKHLGYIVVDRDGYGSILRCFRSAVALKRKWDVGWKEDRPHLIVSVGAAEGRHGPR